MVVPFERFAEMMDVYRRGFESRGLDYAIWGHVSDGNVHPNVIPRSFEDGRGGRRRSWSSAVRSRVSAGARSPSTASGATR